VGTISGLLSEKGCAQLPIISTVDAFQGAEREVILVSTCRSERLGFVER
jgi:superfamily I DNA and/or RNA helicase